jgi:cytochrome P450
LRDATPIQIFGRNATRDLELHSRTVKRGDVVALSCGSANHDSTTFPHPETCVLDRFGAAAPARHLTFGAGVHLCLGAPVARLELGITLREFTARVPPLTLAPPDGVRWKPSGDRRGIAALPVALAS